MARRESDRAEEAADEYGWPVSPRRKVDSDEPDFFEVAPEPPRRWGLPLIAVAASLLMAAAIAVSTLMLVLHEQDRRAALKDSDALGYVREFMVGYTSLDPFNANAYADRILSQGTGDFATMFKEKQNEILIQVAQAEPTTGTVVEAGVQRWRDDGSVDVLVATKVSRKSPDGKANMESGNRWVATAIKEGQQWKISQLIQVI
jgi:Mce-associated membrane protein